MQTFNEKRRLTFGGLFSKATTLFFIFTCIMSGLSVRNLSAQQNFVVDTIAFAEPVFHIDSVDVKPQYPGGDTAMLRFMASNIQYPIQLIKDQVQGKVVCAFIINKHGEVTDPFIMQGVHPALNNEALRVIKLMDKWIPAIHKGDTVSVVTTVPFNFRLGPVRKMNKVW